MGTPTHPLHRTVLAVDVSSFGRRAVNGQGETRRGLYAALVGAFDVCGLDFAATHHEDRGDGVLVLIPPDVAKSRLVRLLPEALAGELRRHNATHHESASIRLRVAITAGEVQHDAHGVVGDDVNLAFRLLDSEPLRRALERTDDVLVLIVSRRFHEDVVRDDPAVPAGAFQRVEVGVKEVRDHAWLRATGPVAAPGPRHRSRHRRPRSGPRSTALGLVAVLLGIAVTDASAADPPAVPPCPAPVQLVVLTSRDIFAHQTVAAIAPHVRRDLPPVADQGVVTGDAPLTPIQRWFLEHHTTRPEHFDQSVVVDLDDLDVTALRTALKALVEHHDALRTRFEGDRQVVGPVGDADPLALDGFDLSRGPLLRAVVLD
ncbi:hypothetical protein K7G98_20555, partial [Saccharothrix sp. MB29]|nr:hypothetical protein [Saccharothrix sp. MB29]